MLKTKKTFHGKFIATCFDKNGNFKWRTDTENIVVNEGLDANLNIMFHDATKIATWYLLLFEDNVTPLATHTYAVPGFTETVAYDEGTRPAYNEAAASGQSMTNAANKGVFTFNATKNIYGAALVGGGTDDDTKGDKAGGGTLWCAAKFASVKAVDDDDIIELIYVLTSADDGA